MDIDYNRSSAVVAIRRRCPLIRDRVVRKQDAGSAGATWVVWRS